MKNTLKKLLLSGFVVLTVFTCALVSSEHDTEINLPNSSITLTANAAKSGYYTYEVSNGKAKIVAVDCETIRGKIKIPSKLGGYPVTEIGHGAFSFSSMITSVVIPNTVTRIGTFAFHDCSGMTSITIPNSVKSIGYDAFIGCSSLTSITIPDSVTRIEENVFNRCTALKSITLPSKITQISNGLFEGCTSLKSVTIPSKVKNIGAEAFAGCSSLKSITIPDSVTEIGESAFEGCTSLTSVKMPKNIITLEASLFKGCTSLKSITIPDSVVNINAFIFSGCTALKSIVIPSKSTAVGVKMFEDCTSLTSVVISDGVSRINTAAFKGCTALKSITLPDSITSVSEEVFEDCTALTSIKLSANLTAVSQKMFSGCTALKSITIPDSVSKISVGSFKNCTSLKSITFPKSVRSIGMKAFEGCTALKAVVIPANVKTLETYAFSGCTALETVTISKGIRTIKDFTFKDCTSLLLITIADSVKSITYNAFANCTALKKVFYTSSKADWNNITINSSNKYLKNATISYDCCEHTFSSKVTKEATCKENGTKTFKCTKCSYSYARSLKKVTHKYKNVITAATLTKNGKVENKCIWCSKVLSTTVIYYPKTIKLSKTEYTYNGNVQTPKVTVTDSKGNALKKGTDYTVKLESGRKLPGRYTVTVTFTGKYSGTKNLTYTIAPKTTSKITAKQTASTITLTWNKVTGATGYRVYQYNSSKKEWVAIQTLKTNTLKVSGLKSGTTYKFKVRAYKNDAGTIWSSSSEVLTTATKPVTPKITSLTSTKAKATLKWSNVSGESGYVVYYSTKQDSGFTKLYTCKANALSYTKANLTSGKTYYFKVRAYKTAGDTTVYSNWSDVKSIKIK